MAYPAVESNTGLGINFGKILKGYAKAVTKVATAPTRAGLAIHKKVDPVLLSATNPLVGGAARAAQAAGVRTPLVNRMASVARTSYGVALVAAPVALGPVIGTAVAGVGGGVISAEQAREARRADAANDVPPSEDAPAPREVQAGVAQAVNTGRASPEIVAAVLQGATREAPPLAAVTAPAPARAVESPVPAVRQAGAGALPILLGVGLLAGIAFMGKRRLA